MKGPIAWLDERRDREEERLQEARREMFPHDEKRIRMYAEKETPLLDIFREGRGVWNLVDYVVALELRVADLERKARR